MTCTQWSVEDVAFLKSLPMSSHGSRDMMTVVMMKQMLMHNPQKEAPYFALQENHDLPVWRKANRDQT